MRVSVVSSIAAIEAAFEEQGERDVTEFTVRGCRGATTASGCE